MRFWEKNYLYTLTLFALLVFACIFFITTTSFSAALSSERDSALREEYILSLSIQNDVSEVSPTKGAEAIRSLFSGYASYYKRKNIFMSLEKGGSVLYSNLPMNPGYSNSDDNARVCNIFASGTDKFLYIQDTLGTGEDIYRFVYLKDLTPLYSSASRQEYILFSMGATVSCVFALALYFTLKSIYRPVSNLAHELRTPLTAIRGYAEYIQAAAASEEERYSASQYIIDESKRLTDVCEKLLVMANLRDGNIPFENVSIKTLFENAKMTYKNVEYNDTAQVLKGNKALLQSMINNLVSNAIKASDADAAVWLRNYDNVIEVADTGKGMSKQTMSQITKTVRRPETDGNREGNGLGLPLCFQIARLHGAQLTFESEPGEGTTVRIIFTAS